MSSQKIIDAILSEAQADCEARLQAARRAAEQSRQEALTAAQENEDRVRGDLARECGDIVARARQSAALEARKNTLVSRRRLIDSAFDGAVGELAELDGEAYAGLITRLVCRAAETGREQLVVPERARVRYEKPFVGGRTMIELLNSAYHEQTGRPAAFALSAQTGDFRGGIRLVGEKTDIDCSFEALVAEWRESHEAEVSQKIFDRG